MTDWIKAEDQLPEQFKNVVVLYKTEDAVETREGYYEAGEWYVPAYGVWTSIELWQPMPELPMSDIDQEKELIMAYLLRTLARTDPNIDKLIETLVASIKDNKHRE